MAMHLIVFITNQLYSFAMLKYYINNTANRESPTMDAKIAPSLEISVP